MKARFLKVLAAAIALSVVGIGGYSKPAQAQEILLTGPLAGAPAVRKLRLYRKGRLEFAPGAAFTLLDEYKRQILIGGRLNFNFTDWIALGVWGGYGGLIQQNAALSREIQKVNEARQEDTGRRLAAGQDPSQEHRLTAVNISQDFTEQLGTIEWVASPQITLVPFRGKIALFQSIYVDTDFYLYGGVAFAQLNERAACSRGQCGPTDPQLRDIGQVSFEMEQRLAIAPSFGLGFQFYLAKWLALGVEWRAMPFKRNVGGFDNRGTGADGEFPDLEVDSDDREMRFNQMIAVSLGIHLPFNNKVSE